MPTTESNGKCDATRQAREEFSGSFKRQAEQIEKLAEGLKLLQNEQQRLEEAAFDLLEPLENTAASGDPTKGSPASNILSSVRQLMATTYAGQVFEVLAEEAARMSIRAAVFDVRGRAAWGSSASGFDPELSGETLRTLVVPLNQDGPFRQAFETAEAVKTNAESLERNRNVLAKLGPAANARILLLPVRSAGCVAAIFYADTGERRDSTLIDSLKVLVEFAGAQLDRLMVLSGGLSDIEAVPAEVEAGTVSEPATAAPDSQGEAGEPEAASSPESPEVAAAESSFAEPSEEESSALAPETAEPSDHQQSSSEAPEVAHLSDEEQRVHRDAQRFSRLLVSEIELYNKNMVEEGRRNKDLYQRLKKDIDRSRVTYEKRFANTVANQVDYFHEDLVRTLAENDPTLLGTGYPGPSV